METSFHSQELGNGLEWLSRLTPVSFWIVSKDEESWRWMVRSLLPVGHLPLWKALLTTRRASLSWSLGLECAHAQRCAVLWSSFSSDAQALNPLGWTWGLSVSSFLRVMRKISEMRLTVLSTGVVDWIVPAPPPEIHVQVLTSRTRKCDLILEKGFSQILSILRWNYPRFIVSLKSNDRHKQREIWDETQERRREGMERRRQRLVMLPQAMKPPE